MRITGIYDNGGKTLDRYTIMTDAAVEWSQNNADDNLAYEALGLDTGGHGYSQWGVAVHGRHLGRAVRIEDLDDETQAHIARRIFSDD